MVELMKNVSLLFLLLLKFEFKNGCLCVTDFE